MFNCGDYVMYGDTGLCRVERVAVPDFDTFGSGKLYYFLHSEADGSRIYTPVDTQQPLRAPITHEQAEALLAEIQQMPVSLPTARDRKNVQQHYRTLLQPHTCQALACTIKSILTQHRGAMARISGVEQDMLKKAETLLCNELAAALEISSDDAKARLREALQA